MANERDGWIFVVSKAEVLRVMYSQWIIRRYVTIREVPG
jgi:hypothetical protein